MKDLDSITRELTAALKRKGYRKNRLTWYKEQPSLTIVFSVEKSQYAKDTWYYWFGICLHDIAEAKSRSIGNCQVKHRLDNIMNRAVVSTDSIISLLDRWESMYGDLHSLRTHALQGQLPPASTLSAKRYLTSLDLSKYAAAKS